MTGETPRPKFPGVPDDPLYSSEAWAPMDWFKYIDNRFISAQQIIELIADDITNACAAFSTALQNGQLMYGMLGDPALVEYLKH